MLQVDHFCGLCGHGAYVAARKEAGLLVPDENHRERVLSAEDEALYFAGAKSEAMNQNTDSTLLSDVARILLDCGLRPEECFRLRPESVRDGKIEIQYGNRDMHFTKRHAHP